MNKIAFTVATFGMAFFLFFLLNGSSSLSADTNPAKDEADSFVVIELFTSQGCSSCPPADRLLSELLEEAEKKGQNIFPLSFHVDYWNYLGWADPFSKKEFSSRQKSYANALSSGVYTPQMVFNGKEECVGSNRYKVSASIQKVSGKTHRDKVELNLVKMEDKNALRVDYSVSGEQKGKWIHVALVERNISTQVKRGENGGRKLHHDNVVREFKTIDLTGKGSVVLTVPKGLSKSNSQVVVYAQEKATLEITGAAKQALE